MLQVQSIRKKEKLGIVVSFATFALQCEMGRGIASLHAAKGLFICMISSLFYPSLWYSRGVTLKTKYIVPFQGSCP
jgi:hypothetical protein